ncbi:hypothetical protein CFAM422_005860 [Trichoderma lentiforme]|uniref:Uncharacterized protein n=1 Tax=Trichoderma lentiforme TaxID=1567552 RepID=A0A9P5CE31_9HYPO|nr:hypothetical protein CFAM422_005860 [Trichoderma lentiforme]
MGYVKDIPFDKTGILVPGRNQPGQEIMDCPDFLSLFSFKSAVFGPLVVGLLLLLGLEPVRQLSNTSGGLGGSILTLDLNGHGLVGLEVVGQVSLLGRGRGLGHGEDLDLALSIGLLDGGGLVGLELLEVELLDEVG